ncbi:hypothetical protein JJJ17_11460 [Paracoccus caeni]|uniref:Uncharacterized protein n=1 Tax=Paracoccus caeni TaxID=657651 RepID=A0A934SK26_9RHOB|nr:hypothetical protein [Paracoccus caeni]MBK4216544.1 hypothetical protein [Paracoccus caeni]
MSLSQRIASFVQADAASAIGAVLSLLWLVLLLLFWLFGGSGEGSGGVARLVMIVGMILPLVLIWLAVGLARAIAALRAEADDLRYRLTQMREMAATRGTPPPARPVQDMRDADLPPEPAFRAAPPAPKPAPVPAPAAPLRPARPVDGRQTAMSFDGPEAVSVPPERMVTALNFPDGPDDHAAISALRMALKDPQYSRVLRAAQDVVTLLAAQDVYMDDLQPEPAPASLWLRFADGVRGSSISGIGGVRDEIALEIAGHMMRGDEIFRDSAHHFLRQYDVALTRLISQLDEDQIGALADTRSTRAFMLLGRVAGMFD